jgi:hypothetical protein
MHTPTKDCVKWEIEDGRRERAEVNKDVLRELFSFSHQVETTHVRKGCIPRLDVLTLETSVRCVA